ncbi:MAG TPA: glycosyltransferase family 4 protein [Bacteroidota bacterium]|nr:glycosyltransferase family 4 protein [Bacteroidota bacterium]
MHASGMNILFLNSNREWGGGEVWLTAIVRGLQQRGHHATVICQPGSPLFHRLMSDSFNCIPLALTGDFNPFTIFSVWRIIKQHSINLVCVHTEKQLRITGCACLMSGVPIVVSREVDVPIDDTFVNRYFFGKIASAVMVNSRATRDTLFESAPWLRNQSVRVVWKGIDISVYDSVSPARVRKEFGLSDDDCLVGFVGRLDEQKGIPTLLEAMSIVSKKNPRIKLILVGDGNLKESILQFSVQNMLEHNIYLTGFREDIPAFLKAMDFVVVPSYWEGFCYAALEAMAAGKAVIGSHTSSIPELVADHDTGILVASHSPEELVNAIINLSENPSLQKTMGDHGRRRAEKLFQFSTMLEKTEALFREVIDGTLDRSKPA